MSFLPSLKAVPVELTGFLIALIGTHIFFRFLGYLFNNMLGNNGQSTLDRMGGAFIGFVKGAFIGVLYSVGVRRSDAKLHTADAAD